MRVTEKIDLTSRIGAALEAKYDYNDLRALLTGFNIRQPSMSGRFTLEEYAKEALRSVRPDLLVQIAEELGLAVPSGGSLAPPRNWRGAKGFRLFISHVSKAKDKATRLKACLTKYGIDGFVAHEDIEPTAEWQTEIERALHAMDAFLAVHTAGFSQSFWAQQEVGFAHGRGVKIISFKMDEDPTGFISKRQAVPWRNRLAEEIAAEIDGLLATDPTTADRLAAAKKALAPVDLDDDIPF